MALPRPVTVNALHDRRDRIRITRWAFCPLRFAKADGSYAPRSSLTSGWLEKSLWDPEGIASFFRYMSGGRQLVEWVVLPDSFVLSQAEKDDWDTKIQVAWPEKHRQVRDECFAFIRQRVADSGFDLNSVDHIVFINEDAASKSGVAGTNALVVGAMSYTPQLVIHEMLHVMGSLPHADRRQPDGTVKEYDDPYCIMGFTPGALAFASPDLILPNRSSLGANDAIPDAGFDHNTVGPGMCGPYQFRMGWLKPEHMHIIDPASVNAANPFRMRLFTNRGSPMAEEPQIVALLFGSPPEGPDQVACHWLELRVRSRFDQGISDTDGTLLYRSVANTGGARRAVTSVLEGTCVRAIGRQIVIPGLELRVTVTFMEDGSWPYADLLVERI